MLALIISEILSLIKALEELLQCNIYGPDMDRKTTNSVCVMRAQREIIIKITELITYSMFVY